MTSPPRRTRVGELRPSQLLHTYGVGAIIDLPSISAMVMGLDDWTSQLVHCRVVPEERLLAAVRSELGAQVERLLAPPAPVEQEASFMPTVDDNAVIGIPVAPFPRFMRCPLCSFLGPLNCGLFEFKSDPWRPDRARYVHKNCPHAIKPPPVVPARFLVACEAGHIDDFPWDYYVHHGQAGCRTRLTLREWGVSGEAADIEVHCTECEKNRRMADAFGEEAKAQLPRCTGRRPHLRDYEPEGCGRVVRAILLGASNSWFGVTLSALSLPVSTNVLAQRVEQHWPKLSDVDEIATLKYLRKRGELAAFADFTVEDVWEAIVARRSSQPAPDGDPADLKTPEWELLSKPDPSRNSPDFELCVASPPGAYSKALNRVVLAERLREVTALLGFTRIASPGDYGDGADVPPTQRAPLGRKPPTFVPASEVRGEGIFITFDEAELQRWETTVDDRDGAFRVAHERWRRSRNLVPAEAGYPGIRYVLLHSFSHALMRQLALECGYTAASIRERIYASDPTGEGASMAGVLLYTAAPDSEGTLGGLVSLGEPDKLERHLDQALEAMRLCASDPLCAEHDLAQAGATLHAAACHACLFAPETSCERGNRYLDRALLVETVTTGAFALFESLRGRG